MSARRKKAAPPDLAAVAKMKFEPIDGAATWDGTKYAEWKEESESLQFAVEFARALCAKDQAGVRKVVADMMGADGGLENLKMLLDAFEGHILQCKALAEMMEIAHARVLIGMAAHVEGVPEAA